MSWNEKAVVMAFIEEYARQNKKEQEKIKRNGRKRR